MQKVVLARWNLFEELIGFNGHIDKKSFAGTISRIYRKGGVGFKISLLIIFYVLKTLIIGSLIDFLLDHIPDIISKDIVLRHFLLKHFSDFLNINWILAA